MAGYPQLREIYAVVSVHKTQVLVVGGGSAGIAAAIAASRCGVDVILLEKYGFLGGTATAGMVSSICGLFVRGHRGSAHYSPGGFLKEWGDRLGKACNSQPVCLAEGLWVLPYDAWRFQRLAEEIICETDRVVPGLHAVVTDVVTEGGMLTEVRALVWDRPERFRPCCVVDCSGSASVVSLAGGQVADNSGSQRPGILISLENITGNFEDRTSRLLVLREIARAVQEGRLSKDCGSASFLPFAAPAGRTHFKLALSDPIPNAWNGMTQLEVRWRRVVDELVNFLVAQVPGFRRARLSRLPIQVGVRAERRIIGQATLRSTDVLACTKHPDGIACGTWPVELWNSATGPEMTMLPEGEWYEIRQGCLRPIGFENVFVAGRGISADREALASARVIGTAMATGWAAGAMAAFQATGRDASEAVGMLKDHR